MEDYKKQHKLGKWSVGESKGIFKYDQKTFYNELEDILEDLTDEMQVGMVDEVSEMRREIFGSTMQEAEDYYTQREQEEAYDLGQLWDDDDGEGDGDEMYL